ncbi:MAG: M48 family metallopeptidase [Clostridia bacterium]|nr:M48 family metallopeptidase [Clostridia bacterium]
MDYEIIYTKRKTLSLSVKRDLRVVVRAPFRTPKERIEKFVMQNIQWIENRKSKIQARPSIDNCTQQDIKELKDKLLEIVTPILEKYSNRMGLFPSHVSINTAKTRFGSCSSTGRINFSCRLALYPYEAIEYVCVHELAHLKEMNHSKKFWAIVEKQLPDYKERKKLLK